jgi:hypothetical protein
MKAARPLLLLALLVACEKPPAPAPSGQWTLFELDRARARGEAVLVGAEAVESGLPSTLFIQRASGGGLGPVVPLVPAITEGAPSPYVTTNVWANFPEVWVQPMYILVTHWDANTGTWARLPGAKWIFTVGPGSRFHSPFWQVYWAVVPAGTAADRYRSSEQLLADGVQLIPGPGRLVSLAPAGTQLEPVAESRPGKVNQLGPEPPPTPRLRPADYLDGQEVSSLDFGDDRFEWNAEREVIEQPFFVLLAHQGDGQYVMSGAPNVGGTGPLFERRPAIAPRNRPLFGSFWRLYLVKLPPTKSAALFLPRSLDGRRVEVEDWLQHLEAPPITWDPSPANAAAVEARAMQVALNGSECFKDEAAFATCRWLDSQRAIEENLPASIVRTGITVTCPFIGYAGQPVPLQ